MADEYDNLSGVAIGNTAASEQGMDLFEKHFEAAGAGKDTLDGKEGENTDTPSGEGDSTEGQGAEGKASGKQKADGTDSNSGTKDGDPKQSPDAKAAKEAGGDKSAQGLTLQQAEGLLGVSRQEVASLRNQIGQVTQNRDQWREKHLQLERTVSSLHGVDPNSAALGVRIVKDMQRDPVGTVKKLVAECLAAGHTVDGIQAGLNAEVLALVNRSLNTQQEDTGPTEEQINSAAAQEVTQFYGQYPDARVHDDLLARVLADHPQLNLEDAYFGIKQQFATRGFDWSKPLDQQAKRSDQQADPQPFAKPMTNGRAVPNADAAGRVAVVPETMETGDLVKLAMREAGLNI